MSAVFALLLLFADPPTPRTSPKDLGTGVQSAVIDYYDSLADHFAQSRRVVMAIAQKGIPDNELAAVLLVKKRSSASMNQLIDARKKGTSWADIAKQNKVSLSGDVAAEANTIFLSEYHSVPIDQVRAMRTKGASFVDINQEFRRAGAPRKKTEAAR